MILQDYTNQCQVVLAKTSPKVRELLSRIKADQLYPPFLVKLIATLEDLQKQNKTYYITCGERTWPEQHAIYLEGRRGIPGEHIKTKVDQGDSAHNYACAGDGAYDLDPDKPGLQPSWDKPWLKIYADAGLRAGLDAGFYWMGFVDGPHLQLNLRKYGLSPRKQLKTAYLKSGKLGAFALLDKYSWT